jgi:flagellar hook assembly protein FlgD
LFLWAAVLVLGVLGQRVRQLVDGHLPAGPHEIRWDGHDAHGRDVAAGIYYVRMVTDDLRTIRKLVKLR